MKKVLVAIILLTLLVGCSKKEEIDIDKLMSNNEYTIIDVRTEEEYNELHVVDAINIPYDKIDENIDLDKNKIIFVYCKTGKRSNIAYNKLKELGYTVYDLHAITDIDLPKE